jgi:hypothetical protein
MPPSGDPPSRQDHDQQQGLLDRIETQCPEVIDLPGISRRWIEGAKHSEFGPVMRLAYNLQKKYLRRRCGCPHLLEYRPRGAPNQPNTMIKRQMYGRAGFELLRGRELPHSPVAAAGRVR